jgi:hypothetical protein
MNSSTGVQNGNMRNAAKVDANQAEIIETAEGIGAVATSLHRYGRGVPDLLISYRGRWFLVEVKTETGTLTKAEKEFIEKHWNAKVYIVRNSQQLLDALGV